MVMDTSPFHRKTREKGLEPPALSFGNSRSTIRTPLPLLLKPLMNHRAWKDLNSQLPDP